MTAGPDKSAGKWAATNTLREYQSRAIEPLSHYAPSKKEADAALALVEAALDAAAALHDFLENEKETEEPPRELMDKGYAAMETFADYHREEELADALAAALRAVREGK